MLVVQNDFLEYRKIFIDVEWMKNEIQLRNGNNNVWHSFKKGLFEFSKCRTSESRKARPVVKKMVVKPFEE